MRTTRVLRQARLILLLDAAEKAGLTPIPILQLHTFAYLSNVLAKVWEMPALDGKLLKRRGGPFYPALQGDLDRLIGLGVASISRVSYTSDDGDRWRLEGSFKLNRPMADRILKVVLATEPLTLLPRFVQELAYALSALSEAELARASSEDATYSDPIVDVGDVVDFGEWQDVNSSAAAARRFERLLPSGTRATTGEMLHLYVQHLHKRLHRAP